MTILPNAPLSAPNPTHPQLTNFTERHGLTLTPLSVNDKMEIALRLKAVWAAHDDVYVKEEGIDYPTWISQQDQRFTKVEFYKVAFQKVLSLLPGRRVFLRGGFAYFPKRRGTTLIVNQFTTYLKMALVMANKALPGLLQDERLEPILKSMSDAYTGADYRNKKSALGEVRAEGVEELGRTAFALCMQSLQESLKATSHLKHWGRQQYGLYLKGIGLSLEEALIFWQKHFTRKMTVDDFLKKYAYNIRHNYGKEGKRTDYTPLPCTRIIGGNPPQEGDAHGCPYKHWDTARIRATLEKQGIPYANVTSIMEAVGKKEPQVACRRQFEARFSTDFSGPVGNHPNAYFDSAVAFLKAKAAAAAAAAGGGGGEVATPGASAAVAVSKLSPSAFQEFSSSPPQSSSPTSPPLGMEMEE